MVNNFVEIDLSPFYKTIKYLSEDDINYLIDKNIYYFDRNDISDNESLSNQDSVMFKSKTEDTFPQAYYIKKLKLRMIDKKQGN